jgi:hypothetical protein
MNDGREPTKETMDMAWNAYKMAEDIGDRIADATSPQNTLRVSGSCPPEKSYE